MNDERLRDIVFKVRENELSGRYPFYLIHDEDKCLFFSGLEKKVEQENEKLMNLHKYLHSNIENLDYGAAFEILFVRRNRGQEQIFAAALEEFCGGSFSSLPKEGEDVSNEQLER
ncbi:Uncharacterized protein Fot_20255 [Forsythia ovata]|uniref:Uncharacterized protein n=1 Tax=Forsythia ovata TaxID=205694 RepID=A0ABD1VND9_9LAMI